ncbi:MAG: FAD-dependent oxidoreductase [Flavobacterium sp.]
MLKTPSVCIIGAGAAGLAAARVLEESGYTPLVLEADAKIGGRLKTDIIEGYALDHGFQVLLTAYPAVKKYLDLGSMKLNYFHPGAVIFSGGKQSVMGDPLRQPSMLFKTLLSSAATVKDKLLVYRLTNQLKAKSIEAIFNSQEVSTLEYLKSYGFSNVVIEKFFRPFFAGIYLEDKLSTSSRMFEFIYKMFSQGSAAVPENGIQDVAQHLANSLKKSIIRTNASVVKIDKDSNSIYLQNGDVIKSDYIIVATNCDKLLSDYKTEATVWKKCTTLYFKAPQRVSNSQLIGLVTDVEALINTVSYVPGIAAKEGGGVMISVTVVKNNTLDDNGLVQRSIADLKKFCGFNDLKFVKLYHINKALPDIKSVSYIPQNVMVSESIFAAGDALANGSLNAALLSGEEAAKALINHHLSVVNG